MAVSRAVVCAAVLCLAISAAGASSITNKGNVKAKQGQAQGSINYAAWNKGDVNQQSSNQAVQQAGNGNYADNESKQTIKGRHLLGGDTYKIDNSGKVWAKQGQFQASGNFAKGNKGPVNQQSSNQAVQQAGNGNDASNSNSQTIKGRHLLGDKYVIDNKGNVKAKQSQYQGSFNYAKGNSGPVNQQSSNQAVQQAGNGNSASNSNSQTIKGRHLLGDTYKIDNSGNVWAKQGQFQASGNFAKGNKGAVNQQSSNQAIQQAGNGNSASNSNSQTIKGRHLLGDTYKIDNTGNVWAKQGQFQASGNVAKYNKGAVNQQSSNQAVQQAGNGNSASNSNKQTIKP